MPFLDLHRLAGRAPENGLSQAASERTVEQRAVGEAAESAESQPFAYTMPNCQGPAALSAET